MKYLLILLLTTSCGLFHKTRKDKILACIERFIDRDIPSGIVFKECRRLYEVKSGYSRNKEES